MNKPSPHLSEPHLPEKVFVNRAAELALLAGELRETRAVRPRLVVVTGSEGIGKTALIERFAATVVDGHVLRASGAEAETYLRYGLLEQLLMCTSGEAAPAGGESSDGPAAAGATLIDELGRLDGAGPLVMIVDDAHWADRPSLDAISFALRRVRVVPLVTVMVVRDIADTRIPDGMRRLLESDGALRMRLEGLDVPGVSDLCERLTGHRPSQEAAFRLRRHTEGNPLYIRSLLSRLPRGSIDDLNVPLPAPACLAAAVLADMAACGSAGSDLVAAAAVLGDRCPLHLAAQVAQIDEPLAALDRAITAGLLVEEIGTGHVRFRHSLVRSAVYQDHLGPSGRAALHVRAAALAEDPATRLWHLSKGAVGPDRKLAADLTRLGRQRASAGRWTDATRHLDAAARLAPDIPERDRLALEAAEGQIAMGSTDLHSLAVRVRGLPISAWRTYVLALLELNAGRTDAAETLLYDAWRCSEAADALLKAKVAGQMAMLRVMQGQALSAAEWGERALRTPHPAPIELARFFSLYGRGLTDQRPADVLATLTDLPAATDASMAEFDALLGRGRLRIWLDDLAGAKHDLHGIIAIGARLPVRQRLFAHIALAETDYLGGDWDSALAHSATAASLADDTGHLLLSPLCHAISAHVLAGRGDWAPAEQHARTARGSGPLADSAMIRAHAASAAAHLAAARGDPEGVIEAMRPLTGPQPAVDAQGAGCLLGKDLLIDAMIAVGRLDDAECALGRLERHATSADRRADLAAAARARGNLHAARRESKQASTAFENALELVRDLEMPLLQALTEYHFGAWLRRLGKRTRAAAHLERAHTVFESLRAHPYMERGARELLACGRPGHKPQATTWGKTAVDAGLTAQELAVAQQAAKGLTNRQIARELVVSVKTVEYHLSHIYPKLHIRSRTQLALLLAQR